MIHIALGAMRPVEPADDPLGRSYLGWSPEMTDSQLYRANRGCYPLDARADGERYALFSAEGVVRQAVQIDALVPAGEYRAIEGHILGPGDPVHDRYVGKSSPMAGVRSVVTYFDAPTPAPVRRCGCGCGESVGYGDFRPGHDSDALYQRVARIGSIQDFLRWFDRVYPATTESSSC